MRPSLALIAAIFGTVLFSCAREDARFGPGAAASAGAAGSAQASTSEADASPPPTDLGPHDPFAAQPDESEGLVNVSADLAALLENGALEGACDRYFAGASDRKTMLTCGKWMFFREPFGTAGMPAAIVRFLANNFPDELGHGFEKLGMIPDPTSGDHLPLGMAPTTPSQGTVEALAFTCAACHFAKLPDGRYAVGAPNHSYDYASHILAISLAPGLGTGTANAADHDPGALAKIKPVLDKLGGDLVLRGKFGITLVPLLSMQRPVFTKSTQSEYASWPRGTMDFVISPLPVDDEVHTVSKIMSLWGIPRATEAAAASMSGALLATTGDAQSLDEFVRGFAELGGVAPPSEARMKPLLEYIYSLRAPQNPSPPAPSLVSEGKVLFETKGCVDCHDGPRGSGRRVFTFDEIGTDRAMARWADPELDGDACCNLAVAPGTLKHGIKSPRLNGTWALGRFLHNGALASLEELFCTKPRPGATAEPHGSQGHDFTCSGLSAAEKTALMAFLRAH